jgi:ERCC4-type nuclease
MSVGYKGLRTPRALGSQPVVEQVIVIDTREQNPSVFPVLHVVQGTLTTGDYSVAGLENLFAIERKTIGDLVGCCTGENRERFERELHRIRGFRFKRLPIIGSDEEILAGNYRSAMNPKAVVATLSWPPLTFNEGIGRSWPDNEHD